MTHSRHILFIELTLFTLLILFFSNAVRGQTADPCSLMKPPNIQITEYSTAQQRHKFQARVFIIDANSSVIGTNNTDLTTPDISGMP